MDSELFQTVLLAGLYKAIVVVFVKSGQAGTRSDHVRTWTFVGVQFVGWSDVTYNGTD